MRRHKFLIYYSIFCLASFSLGLCTSFVLNHNSFTSIPPQKGFEFFLAVLQANSKNYVLYILFFMISPLLQFIDLFLLGIQIGASSQLIGIVDTIRGLFPHGFIEIPNFLLYQGLSQYLLYKLVRERDFRLAVDHFRKNLKWYVISYLLLVFAALVEGV